MLQAQDHNSSKQAASPAARCKWGEGGAGPARIMHTDLPEEEDDGDRVDYTSLRLLHSLSLVTESSLYLYLCPCCQSALMYTSELVTSMVAWPTVCVQLWVAWPTVSMLRNQEYIITTSQCLAVLIAHCASLLLHLSTCAPAGALQLLLARLDSLDSPVLLCKSLTIEGSRRGQLQQ